MEKTEYINNLLNKNKVSLKMVYDCKVKENENLKNIERIFEEDSKGKEFLLCQAVLRILCNDNTDKFIEYLKNDTGMNDELNDIFFEKHKTLILTAFIYNRTFFAMAVNLHGLIACKLKNQKISIIRNKTRSGISAFPIRAFRLKHLAAGSRGPELISILTAKTLNLEGIKGELSVYGNNQNMVVQFRFEFKEFHNPFPFFLCIEYVTNADKKKRKIDLNIKHNEYVIVSKMNYNIDFSKGITIEKIGSIKPK